MSGIVYTIEPIGIISTRFERKYDAPRQPMGNDELRITNDEAADSSKQALVQLFPHRNYEQALTDVQGFERVWLLYIFHENITKDKVHWKPKVLPPRGRVKRGVFATRAPYRPNPLGMSVVEVLAVQGLTLRVGNCDLLDGTPIVDVKPYIPQYDSFPDSRTGWLEELSAEQQFTLEIVPEATQALAEALCEHPAIEDTLRRVLSHDPFPHPYRRIRMLDASAGEYEYAYQTWRVRYRVDTVRGCVCVEALHNEALRNARK
jgi:tRNA-Thr(GGU) m(6)t(6)A37 methyltransferase TsaA